MNVAAREETSSNIFKAIKNRYHPIECPSPGEPFILGRQFSFDTNPSEIERGFIILNSITKEMGRYDYEESCYLDNFITSVCMPPDSPFMELYREWMTGDRVSTVLELADKFRKFFLAHEGDEVMIAQQRERPQKRSRLNNRSRRGGRR